MRDGFPGGLAAGAILTLGLCWFLDPRLGPILESEAVAFFAIVATLGAAAIAYAGILRQIQHQNDIEAERYRRELEAERAALPLALSRICEVSKRGMQDTIGHHDLDARLANESMSLEATHVESIKAMIRVSPTPVRVRLQAILRGYQVALASVGWELEQEIAKAPDEQVLDGYTRISLCYRWALLHALSESLFEFSRGGDSELSSPFKNGRLFSAVRFAGILPQHYSDLEGFFERAVERDSSKPLEELFLNR